MPPLDLYHAQHVPVDHFQQLNLPLAHPAMQELTFLDPAALAVQPEATPRWRGLRPARLVRPAARLPLVCQHARALLATRSPAQAAL